MPKAISNIQNKEKSQKESINISQISDNINTPEMKIINENLNKFIYLTPIPNEKINGYIPSTPKKLTINKEEDESYVKGKNLLYIFESLQSN